MTVDQELGEELEQLGYAGRRPLLGQQWLIPARTGLRAAGLPYAAQTPAPILLRHIAVVGRLRLHLAAAYPEAAWESERAIRDHWQGTRVRRADGALLWPDGTATGIECELFVKKAARYQGILHDLDPAWDAGCWWFTPPEHVTTLAARVREAGGGDDYHQVIGLPEEVAR